MPTLQPYQPRVRYRPGVKAWCETQAAEEALGNGWSRYPQLASECGEPTIALYVHFDIDAMVAAFVKPKRGRPKGRGRKRR